jgi:acyl-CoA oxidase
MSIDRVAGLDDPQLRVFAPLIYVAWSDFDLEPEDRARVLAAMAAQPWLRPAARAVLDAWIDPTQPVGAGELVRLRTLIDHVATTSSVRAKASFARVARSVAGDRDARLAADELAHDLGMFATSDPELSAPAPETNPGLALAAGEPESNPGLAAGLAPETTSAPAPKTYPGLAALATFGDDRRSGAENIPRSGGINPGLAGGPKTYPGLATTAPKTYPGLAAFLDGDHAEVRARARQWLGTAHRVYGVPIAQHRAIVRGWLHDLATTGLPRLAFPGITSSDDLAAFSALFEELGHGDLSLLVKVGVQYGLYGGAIWALGTARHHARLAAIASGDELGCFAMSEVGHGSNVAAIETIARYDHATGELDLHTPGESARKEWIGGAAHDARWAVVFAQLEVDTQRHGVHAVLVPIRTGAGEPIAGVRTGDSGHKMGLNGVDNGRLWFEHVRVPVANLLDRFASIDRDGHYGSPIASPDRRFFTMLGTLIGGRVSVGAGAVSAARAALAIAVRYAEARHQFGPETERRLLDYPTHRRRLLPHLAETVVLRVAFGELRRRHAQVFTGELGDTRRLEAEAAALKVFASARAVEAVQAAREACGGQGYLSVNRIPELRTDVDIFTTFEGDNTVLAQLVGKAMLGAYRTQLATGGNRAVLRAVARRVGSVLGVRRAGPEPTRDRSFQLAALRFREDHLVETCAARIKKRLDDGMEGEAAILAVQEHVVAIAEAFAERCTAEWFAAREAAAREAASRTPATADADGTSALIARLGDLALLARLERRAAWFLETGYFDIARSRQIRRAVEALLGEVAPHARDVVDAFGIPDACLAAPIAFFDPAHPLYP